MSPRTLPYRGRFYAPPSSVRMSRLFAGRGVAAKGEWAKSLSPGARICLVSEPKAWRLFGAKILSALRRRGFGVLRHDLPRGERAKEWPAVERLLRAMVRSRLGRDSALVALGGGSVTDSGGFAAAVFMRGIPWVSVPTTLLGQLDGGIGGKTGINLPEGKNLAGAFHQPLSVVCDTEMLDTLPRRERVSGLAEAIKYGLVFDPSLWRFIRDHWEGLLSGEKTPTERVVECGAAWKVRIVAKDERESSGLRELLNFGHTLGHALERAAGLGELRHGEAVIWGMRAALRLSLQHAGLPQSAAEPVEEFLKSIRIPLGKGLSPRRILEAARRDKKARRGSLRFVLLRDLGRPVIKGGITDDQILSAVRALV